jgi:phage tail sheath protein FI
MPVAPTYPGVYIEEIPSGVHTITGVSTSIAAFVGYTGRGPVDQAVHIFSFADFERSFGGLNVDSPLSYCVKHFFQNGGPEAYVVRVAHGAAVASVALLNGTVAGTPALQVSASSAGTWANNVQIDVDYDTANPASLFNMKVNEYILQNGQVVPGRSETWRNLSMNSFDPSYVQTIVSAGSALISVTRQAGVFAGQGSSISGTLTAADLAGFTGPYSVAFTLNGEGPFQATVILPTATNSLAAIATDITTAINNLRPGAVSGVVGASNDTLVFTSLLGPPERSSIQFIDASANSATARLKLGTLHGGIEAAAAAAARPAQTGTLGNQLNFPLPGGLAGAIELDVLRGASATVVQAITLQLWGGTTGTAEPTNLDDLLADVRAALTAAMPTQPFLAGATASASAGGIRILPGPTDPTLSFEIVNSGVDATATDIGLVGGAQRNVGRYLLGGGVTMRAQQAGVAGVDGTAPPLEAELSGSQLQKTGMYALENVDLFNLLVMPDATAAAMMSVLPEAIAYCVKRRAFMIIDAPNSVTNFDQAQKWIGGAAAPLRSRNTALYFPLLQEPDPLKSNVVGKFPAAGAIAGLYARTDAQRGVWKAPAGTAANLVGPTGLSYTLTDGENGTLNPLGLNCLRTFPVYGQVVWGARTGVGSDAQADDYKYIPVRRLALFLEESLYRGTQWVVFEPNDEPLWAQIRLDLGAFMHTLFAQGAFKGQTPAAAYFVKCDSETTTQNDIDLGRVNIVVGFAPLKPAEFVIIQIQQIAGAIQT